MPNKQRRSIRKVSLLQLTVLGLGNGGSASKVRQDDGSRCRDAENFGTQRRRLFLGLRMFASRICMKVRKLVCKYSGFLIVLLC